MAGVIEIIIARHKIDFTNNIGAILSADAPPMLMKNHAMSRLLKLVASPAHIEASEYQDIK